MAISRPLLLALLGIALLGATIFAVQNARNQSDGTPAASQAAQPTPAQPAEASSTTGPNQVLSAAFSPNALTSAAFDARLSFAQAGKRNTIKVGGAYESAGPKALPKLNVQVSAKIPGSFNGRAGFVTTGDRAWLTRGNVGYAVPQAAWSKIVKARAKGTPPTAKAPKLDVNPSRWLQNVKSEGNERMDGVQVTHVSADVNSAAAIADVVKSVDTTGRLPRDAEQRVAKVVDNGHVD